MNDAVRKKIRETVKMAYDKISINTFYLEPPARMALDVGSLTIEQSFFYSQAISMKRIADYWEEELRENKND